MAPGLPYRVWHLLRLNEAPVAIRGQVQGENIAPATFWRGTGISGGWEHQGVDRQKHEVTSGKGSPGRGSWGDGVTKRGGTIWDRVTSRWGGATCQHRVRSWTPAPVSPSPWSLVVTLPGVLTCCPQHPKGPCVQVSLSQVTLWSPYPPITPWGPHYPWCTHHPSGAHHFSGPCRPLGSSLSLGSPSPLGC